jgi:periplasmic protein TonB
MFEQSLVVSRQSTVSSGERWTALTSIFLQVAALGALITLPMLHPDRLSLRTDAPRVALPSIRRPKPVVVQQAASSAPASAAVPRLGISTAPPRQIPTTIDMRPDTAPQIAIIGPGMPGGVPDGLSSVSSGSVVHVVAAVAAPPKKVKVSEGVSAGMLLAPIRLTYPPIAKAAGVQGTVVIEATISKTGMIGSLHVLSGPEMLRGAAIEAVQSARYRPYRLNGEPTEVQTTITLNFKMNS